MRKISAGILCVLMAVIIAVMTTGCKGGNTELTYAPESGSSSNNLTSSTDSTTLPTETSTEASTSPEPNTVVYLLTTQQGETVQVLSTTVPTSEMSTMNYDPVEVPTMQTTYIVSTTQYQPPTFSGGDNTTSSQAKPTESTTEKQIVYKSISGCDGGVEGNTIKIWVDNDDGMFGKSVQAKKGTVKIKYGDKEYQSNCSVLKDMYAGRQVQINVGVPTALVNALETNSSSLISVIVPKGTIVGSNMVANKEFSITLSADF